MSSKGVVVRSGQGPVVNYAPGRAITLKMLGGATGESVMLFEETIPAGTKSWFHLHHGSDEVAYVLSGEITFLIGGEVTVGGPGACAFLPRGVPHAWKNTGSVQARALFLYTPAVAGGLIEEQQRDGRRFSSMSPAERDEMLQRYGWKLIGPTPL